MKVTRKKVLDKNFVIEREWIMMHNKPSKLSRSDAIKILRKHGCTLRKDNSVRSNRGEATVLLTDGTVQALGYHPDRGLAFVNRIKRKNKNLTFKFHTRSQAKELMRKRRVQIKERAKANKEKLKYIT